MTIPRSIAVLCSCAIAAIAAGCAQHGDSDDEHGAHAQPLVDVRTAFVTRGSASARVSSTGHTDALRREKVYAPIAGRITSLPVLEGTAVHAGDLLALIRSRESQAAIAGAESLLRSAATDAQRAEAQKMLALARSAESVASMTAKFDGMVATRSVSEGELVPEGGEILSLVDLSTIVFFADVPLRDIPSVHVGMESSIRFASLPAGELRAVVDAVLPQSDAQSQTVRVRLRFAGVPASIRQNLRTDMVGTAAIVTDVHPNVLFVPRAALLRNDETNSASVVVVTPDSLAHIVPVETGVTGDSTVEVRSSQLSAGMRVVITGNYALADSVKVTFGPKEAQ
jgi:multidrug efflux pump subunit AcrA (membrane-fusion protein)